MQSNRFPQAPLHAVTNYGSAQRLAHREPDTQARGLSAFPGSRQIKHRHVGGEMPSPLFVHALEIGVTE